MMAKLFCASALLAAAGAANGAVFGVNTIDAGGVTGGSLGAPITWTHATNGNAYNNTNTGDLPPSPSLIGLQDSVQFDSYIAIDPIGPSTPNTTTNPPDGYQALGPGNVINPTASPTTVFQSGSLSGVWFNAAAGGGFVNSGPGDRIFIAQISLRPGSSGLSTAGILANIKDAGTVNPNGSLGTLKFGLANATNNGGLWGQNYHLEAVTRGLPTSATPGMGAAFLGGTSYAVFIVATPVPAPGAAGLAGLAGLVAIRRRRA